MKVARIYLRSCLSHASMTTTARNYLRLETIRAANDAITNATAKLPAFHLYDIQDTLHSSSDGQRIEMQIDTINARHSPKYFGLQKGVSAYTLEVLNLTRQRHKSILTLWQPIMLIRCIGARFNRRIKSHL